MFQILICITLLLLGGGSSIAQPGGPGLKDPLPFATVPPAWPTLALNANKAPSCVFWTPPVTGAAPEYFCAVIVANTANDPDATLCPAGNCAAGALRAVRVNPATGAITIGAAGPTLSIILGQDPDSVTCTVIPPGFSQPTTTVQCLIGSVHRVGWDGTKWWSSTYPLNDPKGDHTGIQGPGPDPGFQVTSNFSCVPWSSGGTTTCFGLETGMQAGNPTSAWIDQWTRNTTSVDWKRPTSPLSAAVPVSGPDPNSGPLVCLLTAPATFACIARTTTGGLFELTAAAAGQSVTWNSPKPLASVATGHSCVTFPSATSTPARTDCFFGDGGSGASGLFSTDDITGAVRLVMGESFPLMATPSCIDWALGMIECFFPDKKIRPEAQPIAQADAMIFHVLSFGEDIRTMLAEFVSPPSGRSPGFWQEDLGVAAPTMELGFLSVGPGSVHVPSVVSNPKTLTSFACFKGPPFQSLCVAGLIDSKFVTVQSNPTPAQLGTYIASRRLVFKLVGNPFGVAPTAPTTLVVEEPPVGGLRKPTR